MSSLLTKLGQSTSYFLWLEIETHLLWFSDLLIWNNSAIWLSSEDRYLLSRALHKLSSYKDTSTASGLKIHFLIYIWQPILAWSCCTFKNISASVLQDLSHWPFSLGKARMALWVYMKSSKYWLALVYFYSSRSRSTGSAPRNQSYLVLSVLENSPFIAISNSVWLCWELQWQTSFPCMDMMS